MSVVFTYNYNPEENLVFRPANDCFRVLFVHFLRRELDQGLPEKIYLFHQKQLLKMRVMNRTKRILTGIMILGALLVQSTYSNTQSGASAKTASNKNVVPSRIFFKT